MLPVVYQTNVPMVHVVLFVIYIMFMQALAPPTDLTLPLPPPDSPCHHYTYYLAYKMGLFRHWQECFIAPSCIFLFSLPRNQNTEIECFGKSATSASRLYIGAEPERKNKLSRVIPSSLQ